MKCVALALAVIVPLCGCGLSMTEQRKYPTYAPATLWPDGTSARPLPDNVIRRATASAKTRRRIRRRFRSP